MGAELAKRWKFPDETVEGIRQHPTPLESKESSSLAGLVYLAIYINDCQKNNQSEKEILKNFPVEVAVSINMDTQKAFDNLDQLKGIESGMDSLLDES